MIAKITKREKHRFVSAYHLDPNTFDNGSLKGTQNRVLTFFKKKKKKKKK